MNRLNLYPEERRSKAHADRWADSSVVICPVVRQYHQQGYSALQIASLTKRPVSDIRQIVSQLPPAPRSEYRGRV